MLPCRKQRELTGISQQHPYIRRPTSSLVLRKWPLFLFLILVAIICLLSQQNSPLVDYSSVQLGYEGVLLPFPPTPSPHEESTARSNAHASNIIGKIRNVNNITHVAPSNLRLVFVGDSLSRYMYLSLVYYLKHNEWAPSGHELLEKVKDSSPDAWNNWLALTNRELGGSDGGSGGVVMEEEECDCYRSWTHPFQWYKHCENRYYYHSSQANYVAFITKFGGNKFHGHVLANQVFQRGRGGINQTVRSYDWVYPTWDGLVEEYLALWNPKPTILIFNQGHWKAHELRDEKVLKKLRRALKKHGMRGIYRTTTFRQDERVVLEPNGTPTATATTAMEVETKMAAASFQAYRNVSTRKHDALLCQYFECLNVSWTAGIPTSDYVDPVHFKAPINNRMNQQFLNEFVGT